MDTDAARAAFDDQLRRRVPATSPAERVEREEHVTRVVCAGNGWNGLAWSDLDPSNADAVIAGQIRRFAATGRPWEWKHYSYDQPGDLPDRLRAVGFSAEPPETLLVAELADLDWGVAPPAGVQLRAVTDAQDVEALVSVHDQAFGGDHSDVGQSVLASLERGSTTTVAVVAWAGEVPVCAGRVELAAGTDFASLWGGGTVPAWRGRGVFRSLVAQRAALAAARGFRYLQVDASADSRPILERLRFVELAITTPFTHPGGAA